MCAHYGIVLTAAGTILNEEHDSFHPRSRHAEKKDAESDKSQIDINTEAREAIRDLFPNIPDDDLFSIIKTAFQKGTKKVGNASELSLSRRAQLAVVAHIRHRYTSYDKMLRQVPYPTARHRVESDTLQWLVRWRGDDENGTRVLEDVFREVVVISDDENSDDDSEDYEPLGEVRDVSVEMVSSSNRAHHLNPEPILNPSPTQSWTLVSPSSKSAREGRRKSGGKKRGGRRTRANEEERINRRGLSRYQAWSNAIKEFRENPHTPVRNGLFESNVPSETIPAKRDRPYSNDKFADNLPYEPRAPNPFSVSSLANARNQTYRWTAARLSPVHRPNVC